MAQKQVQRNNFAKILTLILGAIIVIGFFWHVYYFRNDIFKRFDGSYWTQRYNQSQWIVANSKQPIGDDGLYIFAGYRYMQGDDPSLLNAELPPFGKYLVGLFEITTGYIGSFSVFFSFLFLVLFFLLSKKIFRSSLLPMITLTIFSFEPLFYSQIRAPLLDCCYASFLLLGFLLFLNKKYILAGISFGLFMSIKSPFLIAVVFAVIILWLIVQKKFSLRLILFLFSSTLITFVLSYSSTFLHGHGLIYLLKVQKYIVHFYSIGAKPVVGAVFPMIISGTWYNWFGPVQRVAEWIFLWPFALVGTIFAGFLFFKEKNPAILLVLFWIAFYLAFLTITPVFSRYLLLVMPFMYNLSIWGLSVVLRSKLSSV